MFYMENVLEDPSVNDLHINDFIYDIKSKDGENSVELDWSATVTLSGSLVVSADVDLKELSFETFEVSEV